MHRTLVPAPLHTVECPCTTQDYSRGIIHTQAREKRVTPARMAF